MLVLSFPSFSLGAECNSFGWRTTANAISLISPSSVLVPFHTSTDSNLFVCVVFVRVPMDKAKYLCASARVPVSESGLHRGGQESEMWWCIFKQGLTGRTEVCPAARQANLAALFLSNSSSTIDNTSCHHRQQQHLRLRETTHSFTFC